MKMRITSEVFKLFLDEGKKDNKHFLEFFRIWKTSIKLIFQREKEMKYKTIFFDLDGTITDSAPGIMNSIKYALEKNHLRCFGRATPKLYRTAAARTVL